VRGNRWGVWLAHYSFLIPKLQLQSLNSAATLIEPIVWRPLRSAFLALLSKNKIDIFHMHKHNWTNNFRRVQQQRGNAKLPHCPWAYHLLHSNEKIPAKQKTSQQHQRHQQHSQISIQLFAQKKKYQQNLRKIENGNTKTSDKYFRIFYLYLHTSFFICSMEFF